jgi:hypothetical protein
MGKLSKREEIGMSEGDRLIRDRNGDFKYSVSGLDILDDKSLSTAPKLSHKTGDQKKKATSLKYRPEP